MFLTHLLWSPCIRLSAWWAVKQNQVWVTTDQWLKTCSGFHQLYRFQLLPCCETKLLFFLFHNILTHSFSNGFLRTPCGMEWGFCAMCGFIVILEPGCWGVLYHWQSLQDLLLYILGKPRYELFCGHGNKKFFVNTELAVRSVLRSGGFPKLCLKSGPVLKRSQWITIEGVLSFNIVFNCYF